MKHVLLIITLFFSSCANPFTKDNEPKAPNKLSEAVETKRGVYLEGVTFDEYGLFPHVGDSALFSCLARAAGATDFDPSILFMDGGRPVRHPDIYSDMPGHGATISKDMVNGILWCLFTDEDKERALKLVTDMIEYGRNHKDKDLWTFCTEEDRQKYNISDKDWYGRCVMTPAVSKDVYRVAIHLGWECDTDCKIVMNTTGTNIPVNATGFRRHLAVLTTTRNGLVEGGLNDNSLNIVLENAAKEESGNAFYLAAYHTFKDGNQEQAFKVLLNDSLFPADHVPTSKNYCTDYLFQRDEFRDEEFTANEEGCITYHKADESKEDMVECKIQPGTTVTRHVANDDWLPCKNNKSGRGVEWLFAEALAHGRLPGIPKK